MLRKLITRKVIFIFLAALSGYLGLCFVLAGNYVHPVRRIAVRPSELREVLVDTRYGPTPSWCTPPLESGTPSKSIFILAHGYGGSRSSWTEVMDALEKRGFDSLALAMPGQDASPAKSVGFGILEAHVIVDAVKWLREKQPGHKIIVLGVSMGGAATWLATREDPKIDGIVTDSAYARFDEPMNAFFNRKLPGGSIVFAPVVLIAQRLAGVDAASIKPVEAAPFWRGKPALVIQGDADSLVVPSHATRLAHAAECPVWMVHGAGHVESFTVDPKGYLDHLANFAAQVESTHG